MKLKYLGAWKAVDEGTGTEYEAIFTEDMELGAVLYTHDFDIAEEVVRFVLKDESMDLDEDDYIENVRNSMKADYCTEKINKDEGEKWTYWGKKKGKKCVSFRLIN